MLGKIFTVVFFACLLPAIPAHAQSVAPNQVLPSTASLFGTVQDKNQLVVPGAFIRLEELASNKESTARSGDNGAFTFTNLAPGRYKITITGAGMGTFSQELEIKPGEAHLVSGIVLPVATAQSEVHVFANKDEIAEEELHIAEEQRVFGIIPNFYVAYDWNAPALNTKQKYHLAWRATIDPVSFLGTAVVAGIQQGENTFPTYGQGVEGYSKRYAASYGTNAIANILGGAVFPQIFHQDPRYFYKGTGSVKSRLWYAIYESVLCRGDNGKQQFNYSGLLGSLTAGAISNAYYPPSDRGFSLTVLGTLEGTGGTAAANIIEEFFLKRLTSHSKDKAPALQ
jgi:hypothetical protein